MSIREKIAAYHGKIAGDVPWRYRSWEHCFQFFQRCTPRGLPEHAHQASLQLAFYLASWGMYRGSSFLLQYDYTVHLPVVTQLSERRFLPLWETDVGCAEDDATLIPLLVDVIESVRRAYAPIGAATDTLVTKVLLGTLGCVPACDRLFIDGFKSSGYPFSSLNTRFLERVLQYCDDNLPVLQSEQHRIEDMSGVQYPVMKLVDMYFWQIGYERDTQP